MKNGIVVENILYIKSYPSNFLECRFAETLKTPNKKVNVY